MRLHELEEGKIYIGEDGDEYELIDDSLCRIVLGGKYVVTRVSMLTQNFTRKKVKRTIEVVRWINIYPGGTECLHKTKEEADKHASVNRIACVKLSGTYEVEE